MTVAVDEDERQLTDAMVATFRSRYVANVPFAEDRALADDLASELIPVVEALLFARRAAGQASINAAEYREALAMLTLLGRRLGVQGATPSAAMAIGPAISVAFEVAGLALSAEILEGLRLVSMEGYVAGRDDRAADEARVSLSRAQPVVTFAPRCVLFVLCGAIDSDGIAAAVERFGRALLSSNAIAAVVDVSLLGEADPARAAEVFNADATARMLGVRCFFTGVTPPWVEAGRGARVPFEVLDLEPSFERAVANALHHAGFALGKVPTNLLDRARSLLRRR